MAFGAAPGLPASRQQLEELGALLERAGYESFREARHPLSLSQRQSAGKFTRDEAASLIDRLGAATAEPSGAAPTVTTTPAAVDVVTAFPDEMLADELTRRGWTCIAPS
jgi:hypothetical protein